MAKRSTEATEARRGTRPGPEGARRARVTPNARYTPPIPRSRRRSPAWYAGLVVGLLVVGLLVIVLNYVGVMPGSPTNWYLVGGLVAIVLGALMATQLH
jgi:hypothetical protein